VPFQANSSQVGTGRSRDCYDPASQGNGSIADGDPSADGDGDPTYGDGAAHGNLRAAHADPAHGDANPGAD